MFLLLPCLLQLPSQALLLTVCVVSHSRVRLFAAPWTVYCQAPLFMEFSRQEYWSGLPLFTPGDLPDSDWTHISCVSCIGRCILYHCSIREVISIWGTCISGKGLAEGLWVTFLHPHHTEWCAVLVKTSAKYLHHTRQTFYKIERV